jgi:hypothetical protein
MNEVTHFMIYAEINEAFVHVSPQQRTCAKQIEDDAPASNLGMIIAARMILPMISEFIDQAGLRQSSDEN